MAQSANADSNGTFRSREAQQGNVAAKLTDAKESIEFSDEELFKKAVAQALGPINRLKDIPPWWIPLIYEQTPQGNRPKTIDIFPKEMMADKLPFTIVQIGEKMYAVTPDVWFQVDDVYVDAESFHVIACKSTILGDIHITASKTKDEEMGIYLLKLYSQWEDGRYKWSTVQEIPKSYQKTFLEEFDKLNR